MLKRKSIRQRGKIPFNLFFQTFKVGGTVALVSELSVNTDFPKRMQGKTGKVIAKRGRAYVVQVNDLNMSKQYAVKPVHLKKIGMEVK